MHSMNEEENSLKCLVVENDTATEKEVVIPKDKLEEDVLEKLTLIITLVSSNQSKTFESTFQIPFNKDILIKDALADHFLIAGSDFILMINGNSIKTADKVSTHLKNNQKLLLMKGNKSKPEGMRFWLRFPKHCFDTSYYTGTDYGCMVFIPNQDIEIHGYRYYAYSGTEGSQVRLTSTFYIHDEKDSPEAVFRQEQSCTDLNIIEEEPYYHPETRTYDYNFVKRLNQNPIKVTAGQHIYFYV